MADETGKRGVIWCPGCDSVLEWQRNEDGDAELVSKALDHLKVEHDKVLKTPVLREPARA